MTIDRFGSTSTDPIRQVETSKLEKAPVLKGQTQAQKPAPQGDTTAFSSGTPTTAVASLAKAALEVFPSRQAKVEALKLTVSSAQYQLDADKIAASLADADV